MENIGIAANDTTGKAAENSPVGIFVYIENTD